MEDSKFKLPGPGWPFKRERKLVRDDPTSVMKVCRERKSKCPEDTDGHSQGGHQWVGGNRASRLF
jgi:hypothetical protein